MSHEAALAAATIRNASLSCRALGCTARKIGTAPNPDCVAKECVSADYVSIKNPGGFAAETGSVNLKSLSKVPGEMGSGFDGQTGDIAAHEPTQGAEPCR